MISFSAKKLKNTYHTPYTKIKQQSLMETLPHEIVLEIFNNIQKITDKRQFLRTCKTYNNITKQLMSKIKYALFDVYCDGEGEQHYNLISICDKLDDCKQCMIKFQKKYSNKVFNKNNYYAILTRRENNDNAFDQYPRKGFIIEEMVMNEII